MGFNAWINRHDIWIFLAISLWTVISLTLSGQSLIFMVTIVTVGLIQSNMVNTILKITFRKPRQREYYDDPIHRYAFPSNHAQTACVMTSLAIFIEPATAVVLPLVVLVLNARVRCHIHTGTDIIVGAIIGAVIGILAYGQVMILGSWIVIPIMVAYLVDLMIKGSVAKFTTR